MCPSERPENWHERVLLLRFRYILKVSFSDFEILEIRGGLLSERKNRLFSSLYNRNTYEESLHATY
jgi:hypothetical protein